MRTSSQALGPIIEDLDHSRTQIEIELNSTTDDFLVDIENRRIHQSGNGDGSSMLSATEKMRSCLEKIGTLLFEVSAELSLEFSKFLPLFADIN